MSLIRLFCHVTIWHVKIARLHLAVDILLLNYLVTCSVSFLHWSVVLWQSRKPNWLTLSRPLSSMRLWTIFRITFSNSLPVVDERLIGRKIWGNFGSLPDFGNVITFASFQGFSLQYVSGSSPIAFLITTLHGPNRRHRFQQFLYFGRFPSDSPNIVVCRPLPSNSCSFRGPCPATGLYATIFSLMVS
jgi:hypothetical protein